MNKTNQNIDKDIDGEKDILYELHKLCEVVLPEKPDWSLDEIYDNIYRQNDFNNNNNDKFKENEYKEILKKKLLELEKQDALIFINGFDSFNIIRPKLLDIISNSDNKIT